MEAMMVEMQERLATQEARLRTQQATIAEQAAVIEAQRESLAMETASDAGSWTDRIEIGGVVEVEAYHASPYDGDDESDVALATFELGIAAQVTDWVEAGASLLYEEDDTPLEVDTAYVTIANAEESPWSLTAGQIYVPFGSYETNLVSDPLTLDLGETRETAVHVGWTSGGLAAGAYLFNGDKPNSGNDIDAWGAHAAYEHELGNGAVAVSAGYLSDLGESDGLQDDVTVSDQVPAWTVSAAATLGEVMIIAEYLAATKSFDAADFGGAKPAAWNVEAGYAFELFDRPATVAAGYQGTDDAVDIGLPERRLLAALSVEIYNNTSLSFEWAHDTDYGSGAGGTGKDGDTVLAQLAVEF
jgi:hypothetical protein